MSNSSNLDDKYKSVLETIKLYPDQFKQAWDEFKGVELPSDYKGFQNIVLCGMGGSALGARMIDSYLYRSLNVPFEYFNQYQLPGYADENTLMIASSYSGNTEEAVSALEEAIKKKCKIFVISAGGKLKEIAEKNGLPNYIIDPSHNPSGQPRMAIGYAIGALMGLFNKLGFSDLTDDQVSSSYDFMKTIMSKYDESVNDHDNDAKVYAERVKEKAVILVASEHLLGTVHTVKNQFNESAKTFAALFELPELNHHLMEGLKNPSDLKKVTHFLFFNSDLYSERVKKRYPITTSVVEKNGYSYSIFSPSSDTELNQIFEVLIFGSFVVYYLSVLYNLDPTEIPWVDYFKEELKQV